MKTVIRLVVVALGLAAVVAGAPGVPLAPAGAVTEVTYATYTDGSGSHDLELKISLPDTPTEDMPMVLLISGGGFAGISEAMRTLYEEPLNDAGIATAWVQYRTLLVAEDWDYDLEDREPVAPCEPDSVAPAVDACPDEFLDAALAAQHDVQAAVRYLRANAGTYDIDPDGIFAFGESAGGITAVNLLHRASDPGTVGSHLTESSEIAGAISIGGVFAREAEQPSGAAPALLFHGEDDFFTKLLVDRWGYDEAREMMDRANQLGNHVEMGSICGPLHVARPDQDGVNPLFQGHVMLTDRITARTIDFVDDVHAGTPLLEEGVWSGPLGSADRIAGQYRLDDAEPVVGDYDGDGHDDILWQGDGATDGSSHPCDSLWKGGDPDGTFAPQHSTDVWSIFDSNDHMTTAYERGVTPIDETGIPRAGDFDGDGFDDLFLFGPSGTSHHYYSDAGTPGGHVTLDHRSRAVWTTIAPKVGDFDGDGKDDLLFWNPASGGDAVLYGKADRTTGWDPVFTTMNNPQTPFVGDFDGDGDDDVYWYGSGSADAMWWSNGTTRTFTTDTSATFDLPTTGSFPHVGDFDGNGLDDLFVYAGGSTRWNFMGTGTHATVTVTKTPMTIWLVGTIHVGDYNADGRDDVVLYASGTSPDAYWQGTATPSVITRITPFDVNGSGHQPVLGRFDGDAATDILWHP